MTTREDKVVDFPIAEERARRLKVEVERLARQHPAEWLFWLDDSAKRHGIEPGKLKAMVEATVRANQRAAKQEQAEQRRREQRAERQRESARREDERKRREQQREQERADKEAAKEAEKKQRERQKELAAIFKLPSADHEARLAALAARIGEDLDSLREEFSTLVAVEEAGGDTGYVEPWPEPVDLNTLLIETLAQVRRYVVVHDDAAAVAIILWIALAWVHEIAVHSPILEFRGADPDVGKTTACGVVKFLAPRGFAGTNLTGPALYRFVDREKPTFIIDNADKLFARRPDLVEIINVSWTRGTNIPRQEHGITRWYDPFCPKVISGTNTVLPKDTKSRCITIKLLPKLPSEAVEDFNHIDDETFVTLRRKFARFAADHAMALKDAAPAMAGLNNRARMNWKVQTAIANLAGGDWRKGARAAAIKFSRERHESSEGKQLLAAFFELFAKHGPMLTSEEVQRLLTEDQESEWAEFRGRGPITKRQIALLLDAYDIHPDVIHPYGRRKAGRGYRVEWFATAFKHFLGKSLPNRTTVRKPHRGKRPASTELAAIVRKHLALCVTTEKYHEQT